MYLDNRHIIYKLYIVPKVKKKISKLILNLIII